MCGKMGAQLDKHIRTVGTHNSAHTCSIVVVVVFLVVVVVAGVVVAVVCMRTPCR